MTLEPPTDVAPRPTSEPGAVLATFDRYDEAQLAVDALSDDGFDVARTSIVWVGLRRVEHVTGRRTTWSAALQGAAAGGWFATFFGLLVAIFVTTDGWAEFAGIILSYLVIGALIGAIWFAVGHAATGGRRDFSAVGTLEAERYEVHVPVELLDTARAIVGRRFAAPTTSGPGA